MTPRESIIFERLLCLAANEYGKSRDEMLAWINDDSEEWKITYQPNGETISPADLTSVCPFFQTTRVSNITVTPDMWDIPSGDTAQTPPKLTNMPEV